MTILASLLSITSGFALMRYGGSPANVIATSIIVDLSLCPLTAIVASRRGRSTTRWLLAGVALGAWALAAVMLLPANRPPATRPHTPQFPPTSDAA